MVKGKHHALKRYWCWGRTFKLKSCNHLSGYTCMVLLRCIHLSTTKCRDGMEVPTKGIWHISSFRKMI